MNWCECFIDGYSREQSIKRFHRSDWRIRRGQASSDNDSVTSLTDRFYPRAFLRPRGMPNAKCLESQPWKDRAKYSLAERNSCRSSVEDVAAAGTGDGWEVGGWRRICREAVKRERLWHFRAGLKRSFFDDHHSEDNAVRQETKTSRLKIARLPVEISPELRRYRILLFRLSHLRERARVSAQFESVGGRGANVASENAVRHKYSYIIQTTSKVEIPRRSLRNRLRNRLIVHFQAWFHP